MTGKRFGSQTPSESFILPYKKTLADEAVEAYELSGRKVMDWQRLLLNDILAIDDDMWVHMKYGYAVPRQNGKNEVVAIRELWGLLHGERILHTAHRTDTSHTAWERLVDILSDAKLIDVSSKDKGLYRAYGKEHIYLDSYQEGGGRIEFRTRTSKGGLGTSYDLLVIDEAQEYQDDQDAALKYTNAASDNPQTIYLGTPPTLNSSGTLFQKMRKEVLSGQAEYTGWSGWSVDDMRDTHDKDAWYQANPSLGYRLKERTISGETGGDSVDFNVQRLGLWMTYSQKSAISRGEWQACKVDVLPELTSRLYIGIKYHQTNVALSLAVKTSDNKVFVECVDCQPIKATNQWILDFLKKASWGEVVIDGQQGQEALSKLMKKEKMRPPILPKVGQIISANADFEESIFAKKTCHRDQPSLSAAVENCEHRAIGSNGGFGYRSIHPEREIALLDSVILARWACAEAKEKAKQVIRY